MPKPWNCCVPGCTNSFQSNPALKYYRIPKERRKRRHHKFLIYNKTLKLNSDNARICANHFKGGVKRSKNDFLSKRATFWYHRLTKSWLEMSKVPPHFWMRKYKKKRKLQDSNFKSMQRWSLAHKQNCFPLDLTLNALNKKTQMLLFIQDFPTLKG